MGRTCGCGVFLLLIFFSEWTHETITTFGGNPTRETDETGKYRKSNETCKYLSTKTPISGSENLRTPRNTRALVFTPGASNPRLTLSQMPTGFPWGKKGTFVVAWLSFFRSWNPETQKKKLEKGQNPQGNRDKYQPGGEVSLIRGDSCPLVVHCFCLCSLYTRMRLGCGFCGSTPVEY